MKRYSKILFIAAAALAVIFVLLIFVKPSGIISGALKMNFNNPTRVDAVFYKNTAYLAIVSLLLAVLFRVYGSPLWDRLKAAVISGSRKLAGLFTINTLLVFSGVYLIVLFGFAITHYDLGYDEAWYIYYAKSFASTAMPFYTDAAGKIAVIDTITMLPHYLLSLVLFKTGTTSVTAFKILSSVLSLGALGVMFFVVYKFYGKAVAALAAVILIAQPGFGFVASSFFGELSQALFLFAAFYYWLRGAAAPETKTIYITSILFALAIHTKFQLVFILIITLVTLHFTDRPSKALRVLLYTLIFTAAIIIFRALPVIFTDPKLLKNQALITDLLAAGSTTLKYGFIADKMQLYNRFFPLAVLLVSLGIFYFVMNTAFERFLFIFTAVTSLWWIFLYPLTTYRNPFMGLISLSVILAILLVKLFTLARDISFVKLRWAAAGVLIIYILYGFSANLIYAYVGYNDGVQFDLDGYRNRLFTDIEYNSTQKDFYENIKTRLRPLDTLYNGSFVTEFYLSNPIAPVSKLKESFSSNTIQPVKYLLITRDIYPLGLEKGRLLLDSVGANWKLEVKTGEFEMYSVKK